MGVLVGLLYVAEQGKGMEGKGKGREGMFSRIDPSG